MNTAVKIPTPGAAAENIQSVLTYEFVATEDRHGQRVPAQIGKGKFAKVYKGWQASTGRNTTPVAIKILHDYANHGAERLFKQEIRLLQEMTASTSVNVVIMLDILHLGPLVMCGCGALYHPACPRGCGVPLARKDPPGKTHPALSCSRCGYELSAEFVHEHYSDLLRPPAKTCCQSGERAASGTIVNFVDREAVVLELLEGGLGDFLEQRHRLKQELRAQHGLKEPRPAPRGRLGWGHGLLQLWEQSRPEAMLDRVMLLEKVRLMVELAEAVAWLHGQMGIVHKDLAPDNVMIRSVGAGGDWRGERGADLRDVLEDIVSYPTSSVQVIDFGLADKEELTRSWYEEEVGAGNIKNPYLSPEAHLRKLPINSQLEIEAEACRFPIPQELATRLMESDIIADRGDADHNHDLHIVKLDRQPQGEGRCYAYFKGVPPRNALNRQFELVRRLGEAHDVYAVGALFYYILTGQHDEVDRLRGLVDGLEDVPCALTTEALAQREHYAKRRGAILERFWQDELMVLILRAMVRGRPQSFVKSRTDRGPEPARRLLRETKRVYHGLQREILVAARQAQILRVTAGAAAALLLLTALGLGYGLSAARQARRERDEAVQRLLSRSERAEAEGRRLQAQLRDAQRQRDVLLSQQRVQAHAPPEVLPAPPSAPVKKKGGRGASLFGRR